MPRNTGVPFIVNVWILLLCFALIWHIWWLAAGSLLATIVTFIVRSYDEDIDYYVPAEEVKRIESAHLATVAQEV